MLSNRRYIGEYKFRDTIIEHGIPALIDDDLFERVQKRLAKNKKAPARHKAEDDYILTLNVICANGQEKIKCRIKPSNQCKIILAKKEVATGVTSRST